MSVIEGRPTDGPAFRPECDRCAALCCIALAFDQSAHFAYDKPAGTPCRHLDPADRCRIHADRADKGFLGCIQFDCLGAGQLVTQSLFGGRTWRDDPAVLAPMIDAFTRVRKIQALRLLLHEAGKLNLTVADNRCLQALDDQLSPVDGLTAQRLAALPLERLTDEVHEFLGSLRRYVADQLR